MMYKITDGDHVFYKSANSLAEAQVYAANYKPGYTAEEANLQPISPMNRYLQDKEFGRMVVEMFFNESRELFYPMPAEVSDGLDTLLGSIKKKLEDGDLQQAYDAIVALPTVPVYFEQSRKDKYLEILFSYLNEI